LIYDINFEERSENFYKRFYNIKNKSFVGNGELGDFLTYSSTSTFVTDDEKYLIFCREGGHDPVVGQVISLPDSKIKFDLVKYLGDKASADISCSENNGKIVFSYDSNQEVTYDLATSEVK